MSWDSTFHAVFFLVYFHGLLFMVKNNELDAWQWRAPAAGTRLVILSISCIRYVLYGSMLENKEFTPIIGSQVAMHEPMTTIAYGAYAAVASCLWGPDMLFFYWINLDMVPKFMYYGAMPCAYAASAWPEQSIHKVTKRDLHNRLRIGTIHLCWKHAPLWYTYHRSRYKIRYQEEHGASNDY